jgi:hypothetical protein
VPEVESRRLDEAISTTLESPSDPVARVNLKWLHAGYAEPTGVSVGGIPPARGAPVLMMSSDLKFTCFASEPGWCRTISGSSDPPQKSAVSVDLASNHRGSAPPYESIRGTLQCFPPLVNTGQLRLELR